MLAAPTYQHLPPFGRHWLTPVYDFFCTLVGLGRPFKARVLAAVVVPAAATIVDVGCGTGVLLEVVKLRHPTGTVIGVDPDSGALAIAARRLKRVHLDVTLHRAYAEALPIADRSADACFSTLAFHHLPNVGKRSAIEEMYRVLKPGGWVVIADFGPSQNVWLRRMLFFEHLENLRGNLDGLIPRYLAAAGFRNVRVVGRKFPGIAITVAQRPAGA